MKKYIKSFRLVALMALLAIACQFSTAFAQDTLYVCSGGLVVYKRAVLQIDSLTHTKPITLPALSVTTAISSITPTTATSGGNVTSDGGATVTARGVCWSTATSPTVSLTTKTTDGTGTGAFASSITGLTDGTTYYVRSYATNSVGTAYGTQLSFTTAPVATASACGAYLGEGSTNYKQFLCKNLGAAGDLYSGGLTYVAAENGDLYQWGRPTDGHEKRTSTTTPTLATSNTPGNANFILTTSELYDWRYVGGNDDRWTDATKATNDPCPAGFKVPSKAQWAAVVANNTKGTWATGYTFGANLFLPASGYRNNGTGLLVNVGSHGYYWSSTVSGTYAYDLLFHNGNVNAASNGQRASGFSVRCIAE